jgi:hypothetical protein
MFSHIVWEQLIIMQIKSLWIVVSSIWFQTETFMPYTTDQRYILYKIPGFPGGEDSWHGFLVMKFCALVCWYSCFKILYCFNLPPQLNHPSSSRWWIRTIQFHCVTPPHSTLICRQSSPAWLHIPFLVAAGPCLLWLRCLCFILLELELQFLRLTVSQPVRLGIRPPFGTLDQMLSCSSFSSDNYFILRSKASLWRENGSVVHSAITH